MKRVSVILIVFVFILLGCEKSVKNDLKENGLNGNVKSIRIKYGRAVEKFGEIVIDENDRYSNDIDILYNKLGKKIEEISYDTDGSIYGRVTYEFNKKWNILKINYHKKDGSTEVEEPYKYDEDGNLVDEGGDNYKYDKMGNRIESSEYLNGKVNEKIKFKYDEKGRILERDHYNYSGLGLDYYKYKFRYTNENKDLERHMYNSDGILIEKVVQVWTEKGVVRDPIEYYDYHSLNLKFHLSTYYDKGTEIDILRYNTKEGKVVDEPMEHILIKFDDKGNMIEYTEDDHKTNKFVYEYDKKGNWTRMTRYEGDEIDKLYLRKIEYY